MLKPTLIAAALLAAAPAHAQAKLLSEAPYAPENMRQFVLHSERLDRDMLVVVATPPPGGIGVGGKRAADVKLPAVYVLDNGWSIAGPIGQTMSYFSAIQPAYIVSIGYAGRDYRETDFSFRVVTENNMKLGDRGPTFLAFLTDELRPFLETRYPLDPKQAVLFGHSLGGLFAANVLASKPDAFAGYIIGSASVRYDPGVPDRIAAMTKTDGAKAAGARRVFVAAGGNEDQPTLDGVARIAAALSGSQIKAEKHIYAGESHISYYPRLTPEALAFVLPPPVKYADAAIALSAEQLDRVVGAYRMPDGRVTTVKRDGLKLIVELTGLGGHADLMPESATRFFIPGFDSVLEFDLANPGLAPTVTLRINGVDIRAVRQ